MKIDASWIALLLCVSIAVVWFFLCKWALGVFNEKFFKPWFARRHHLTVEELDHIVEEQRRIRRGY